MKPFLIFLKKNWVFVLIFILSGTAVSCYYIYKSTTKYQYSMTLYPLDVKDPYSKSIRRDTDIFTSEFYTEEGKRSILSFYIPLLSSQHFTEKIIQKKILYKNVPTPLYEYIVEQYPNITLKKARSYHVSFSSLHNLSTRDKIFLSSQVLLENTFFRVDSKGFLTISTKWGESEASLSILNAFYQEAMTYTDEIRKIKESRLFKFLGKNIDDQLRELVFLQKRIAEWQDRHLFTVKNEGLFDYFRYKRYEIIAGYLYNTMYQLNHDLSGRTANRFLQPLGIFESPSEINMMTFPTWLLIIPLLLVGWFGVIFLCFIIFTSVKMFWKGYNEYVHLGILPTHTLNA